MCTRKPDLENCHNVTLFSTAQAAFYSRDLRVLKTVVSSKTIRNG